MHLQQTAVSPTHPSDYRLFRRGSQPSLSASSENIIAAKLEDDVDLARASNGVDHGRLQDLNDCFDSLLFSDMPLTNGAPVSPASPGGGHSPGLKIRVPPPRVPLPQSTATSTDSLRFVDVSSPVPTGHFGRSISDPSAPAHEHRYSSHIAQPRPPVQPVSIPNGGQAIVHFRSSSGIESQTRSVLTPIQEQTSHSAHSSPGNTRKVVNPVLALEASPSTSTMSSSMTS